ncbi:carbohydrate kinase (plasmid) [Legionella adelaidensis]|uniref:Bifunctional NAD(P)H-hydrate repair enzyme n=1 Tax=Legionella adelaidensis TaxID=45056 RepID=A0A0W0R0Q4_9GAMM|nr:bifunctional ADP-dependent NAD(P)H-hydrate dehydratase/NAD(P)H-hydrate epimerase [Legionella adelaidensis]KTC64521.1 carbohydrate kinase [Legionella adelaidensis]VEH85889.1 carbohydrate kinase [Legionella adelaidensis]
MESKFPLYSVEQIKLLEQQAFARDFSEDELMLSAGQAAFKVVQKYFPTVRNIAVYCGGGNNGGDGYVVARLAFQQGYMVTIYQYKAVAELPSAACHAALEAISAGVPIHAFDEPLESDTELIIDAILGIGIKGKVKESLSHVINNINDTSLPILSLDVPSGLDVDTGQVLGTCIKATMTVTFLGDKLGFYTLDGPDFCGEVIVNSLNQNNFIPPAANLLNYSEVKDSLKPRVKNSHKGMYGHVLIVGGGIGMPGSVCLAAQAALRIGAGVVTIATNPEHTNGVLPQLFEAMVYGIKTENELLPLLEKATVCILGPGLGMGEWAETLFKTTITSQLPLVIDASALHLLARYKQKDDNWILTPHPGEAAVLLDSNTKAIQEDRFAAASALQQEYGGCIVLKGMGTVINTGKGTFVCAAGNPGMATAGMGDTLSGIIGGLIAQGLSLVEAAKLGVLLHAQAGDDAAQDCGERGMLASDLIPFLRKRINLL